MLSPYSVTACLVTRGDQPRMMERILDSLIFDNVIVWDNSKREDMKTAGRYFAAREARTPVVYFQDDDVLVPRETQWALVEAYEPETLVAAYAHGENDGGFGDLPLVGAGAIVDRDLPWQMADRYLEHWPLDDDFLHYCDFAIGVLYPRFCQLRVPFDIVLPVAQHPTRLCNQPWAKDMKLRVVQRSRAVRDGLLVAA